MKRRWLQVHLSTAIVMMFVAGALICVNTTGVPASEHGYSAPLLTLYGWPYKTILHGALFNTVEIRSSYCFIMNLTVGFAVLMLATVSAEFFFRRRERGRA